MMSLCGTAPQTRQLLTRARSFHYVHKSRAKGVNTPVCLALRIFINEGLKAIDR